MKPLRVCLAFALLAGAFPTIAAGDEPLTINVILSLTGAGSDSRPENPEAAR